ncbi:anti-sigma factor [Candidatus Uabimicrobium sp. HlEnr_7]|uniref:anti-sigma factor family protein n=1 Tax=Candidatus Uabimicrobium helgolandensis TaxID=3095367 RepID=UPI003558643C
MNCDKCKDIIYQYIDNSLHHNIQESVSKHLQKCQSCNEHISQHKILKQTLKKETSSIHLPANISSKIYAQVNKQKTKIKLLRRAILAATIIIIAISSYFSSNKTEQKPTSTTKLLIKIHTTEFSYENTEKSYVIRTVK